MIEQEKLTKWLQNVHGYTVFDTSFEHPYTFKTKLSKRVESKSLCECNEKLSIYITVVKMNVGDGRFYNGVDVGITAEKKSKWWVLKAYSMGIDEVLNDIKEVEQDLIKMFNAL